MLTLYDGTTSVCAIKVRLALHEKGVQFQSHNIDLRAGDQFDPDYLKLNPNAVVPTLVNGEAVILESSVILHYLEDTHPVPSLLPADAYARARMRLWMKRVDDIVHPSIGSLTHATAYRPGFLKLDEESRVERLAKIPDENRRTRFTAVYEQGLEAPVVIGAVKAVNTLMRDMESALAETEFLAGPAYSLADCAVTPYAHRLSDLGLLGLWALDCPNLSRWYGAIRERANFAPAITDYLTEADRALFNNVDAQTAGQVKEILDTA